MSVHRVRLVQTGDGQAVRLPKEIAFDGDIEVFVVRSGDVVTVYPARMTLREMADRLLALPPVPAIERRQGDEPTQRAL